MGGRILLQAVLAAVVIGIASAQGNPGTGLLFPADVPSRTEQLPPVRTQGRPRCSFNSADDSAPCEEDGDYNINVRNLVNRLLMQSRSVNEIVSDPMLRVILNDTLTPVSPVSPSTRFGGPRENPVCVSKEELIFPQRAKTPKDDWVFIVNQDNIKQALRVERCFQEGSPCQFGVASRGEVSTVCRQKYVYRRMLTVGTNNIEPEEVLMPSCCVCYSRRQTFDVGSRIGGDQGGAGEGEAVNTNAPSAVPPTTFNVPVPQTFPQPVPAHASALNRNVNPHAPIHFLNTRNIRRNFHNVG